jgi:hypothetical protein
MSGGLQAHALHWGKRKQLLKALVLLFVAFILTSLFSALYFLLKDRSGSRRMVKALTVRVALSVVLFAMLMLGFYLGIITGKL